MTTWIVDLGANLIDDLLDRSRRELLALRGATKLLNNLLHLAGCQELRQPELLISAQSAQSPFELADVEIKGNASHVSDHNMAMTTLSMTANSRISFFLNGKEVARLKD